MIIQNRQYVEACKQSKSMKEALISKTRRDLLVGSLMEIWGVDEGEAREAIRSFARDNNMTINELAELQNQYSIKSKLLRNEIEQSCPEKLALLQNHFKKHVTERPNINRVGKAPRFRNGALRGKKMVERP